MMPLRPFAKSNEKISLLGHGTWAMGGMWGPREDREAIHALITSIECGINFIDTAYIYGSGHSETLIASALKAAKKKHTFVATKIPPLNLQWPARETNVSTAFPSDHIRSLTEQSLKNLRRDYIDLQQFHVWKEEWLEQPDWLESVEFLKKEGKIRFFGVSINDHEPDSALKLVESGVIDSVQVIYNIFDSTPEDKLFSLCQKHKVAVIVRVPFDEGSLTGKLHPNFVFHPKDWRKHYFTEERWPELMQRLDRLKALLGEEVQTLAELALKFCMSQPAVTTVIPGMRQIDHIKENLKAAQNPTLSPQLLSELKSHRWVRNFYPTHG